MAKTSNLTPAMTMSDFSRYFRGRFYDTIINTSSYTTMERGGVEEVFGGEIFAQFSGSRYIVWNKGSGATYYTMSRRTNGVRVVHGHGFRGSHRCELPRDYQVLLW